MPSLDITFCSDGSKCKKRHTCWRFAGRDYMDKDGMYWYSEFYNDWKGGGRINCEHYMETKAGKESEVS